MIILSLSLGGDVCKSGMHKITFRRNYCFLILSIEFRKQVSFQDPKIHLRTVPTFVTAHTFCASRDTRISYGCLLTQRYFCAKLKKAELSKCFWYPKRKLGVTMHFSEIIKLQFGKKTHTFVCILQLSRIIVA